MGLVRFPNEVADRITEDSWTTGWGNKKTCTCLHGHIRQCDLRPGDEHIIEVMFDKGPGSFGWNDKQESHEPVAAWARTAEVPDEMLADKFGPQWRNIVALVRRLASAPDCELRETWPTLKMFAALAAARQAASDAGRDAASDAAHAVLTLAAWYPARSVTPEPAATLVVADLVGEHGFTAEHLDILLEPIREMFGDPLEEATVEEWLGIGGWPV